MHVLGFASEANVSSIDSFFVSNLRGFGTYFGVHPRNVSFCYLKPEIESEVLVTRNIYFCSSDSGDPQKLFIPSDRVIQVALNQRIVDCLRRTNPDNAILLMWSIIIRCWRMWVISVERLGKDDLIPPSILRGMKGTRNLCDNLDSDFLSNCKYTAEWIRIQYDLFAVSEHVSRLICQESDASKRINPSEITELIRLIRKDNWHKYISLN